MSLGNRYHRYGLRWNMASCPGTITNEALSEFGGQPTTKKHRITQFY